MYGPSENFGGLSMYKYNDGFGMGRDEIKMEIEQRILEGFFFPGENSMRETLHLSLVFLELQSEMF